MHLIIDIRSTIPQNPIIARYASDWVDLWRIRHPWDTISYIHFGNQESPENGWSVVVGPSYWWWKNKSLSIKWVNELFRCINFSSYAPYDNRIITISHIFHHGDILYPQSENSWKEKIIGTYSKHYIQKSKKIVVPALSIGQETVDITHIPEEDIEIIPYIKLNPWKWDHHILPQLWILWEYWLYDGSYGSEANIPALIHWYKDYRELGGTHSLILMWSTKSSELRTISDLIQNMNLTGLVRVIGSFEWASMESIYMNASGWIYIGAYYTGGPRIELARSHNVPLLISHISSLEDYHTNATTLHPNHLKELGQSLRNLEKNRKTEKQKLSNDSIMIVYEKIISEKR